MVYIGAEYSLEELFQELKRQAEDENVRSFDEYSDLIDLLVEEKKSYGFFAEDEDLEQIKGVLRQRWNEFQNGNRR